MSTVKGNGIYTASVDASSLKSNGFKLYHLNISITAKINFQNLAGISEEKKKKVFVLGW